METRKCNTCNKIKILQDFYRDIRAKGGYRSICVECTKITEKKYRKKNAEKIK